MFAIKSVFLSMSSAIVLMIIFAIGSGAATIIESYYDTKSAQGGYSASLALRLRRGVVCVRAAAFGRKFSL